MTIWSFLTFFSRKITKFYIKYRREFEFYIVPVSYRAVFWFNGYRLINSGFMVITLILFTKNGPFTFFFKRSANKTPLKFSPHQYKKNILRIAAVLGKVQNAFIYWCRAVRVSFEIKRKWFVFVAVGFAVKNGNGQNTGFVR